MPNLGKVESQAPQIKDRGNKRRSQILKALHNCIIEKGYAKTTLANVASAAGMSASHLLYYFQGKDDILEYYFHNVAGRILKRIDGFRHETPKRQIDLLAGLFFAGKGITKTEIGFMLEIFGVAVNDKELRHEKADLDEKCKAYIAELFSQTQSGKHVSSPKDSAEIAYALLIGLRTAVYFDDNLSLSMAHRLFKNSMLNMAGFDQKN